MRVYVHVHVPICACKHQEDNAFARSTTNAIFVVGGDWSQKLRDENSCRVLLLDHVKSGQVATIVGHVNAACRLERHRQKNRRRKVLRLICSRALAYVVRAFWRFLFLSPAFFALIQQLSHGANRWGIKYLIWGSLMWNHNSWSTKSIKERFIQ